MREELSEINFTNIKWMNEFNFSLVVRFNGTVDTK